MWLDKIAPISRDEKNLMYEKFRIDVDKLGSTLKDVSNSVNNTKNQHIGFIYDLTEGMTALSKLVYSGKADGFIFGAGRVHESIPKTLYTMLEHVSPTQSIVDVILSQATDLGSILDPSQFSSCITLENISNKNLAINTIVAMLASQNIISATLRSDSIAWRINDDFSRYFQLIDFPKTDKEAILAGRTILDALPCR